MFPIVWSALWHRIRQRRPARLMYGLPEIKKSEGGIQNELLRNRSGIYGTSGAVCME